MYKSLKTKNHLTTCSANFSRLRKILCDFENDTYTFEILNNEQKNRAEFLVISRTPHTLMIEAKFKNKDAALINFLLRINIYIDAKLAEVISYQQEKPVPFFVPSPFSQSQDEKYQQNRILTEWLENIFLNGAVEAKEINFLLRINIYIDAKLAEVISYQQEKPVPFFIPSPFSQSQDEKYQQNRILTEWLENIFLNGAVEAKEINFLND